MKVIFKILLFGLFNITTTAIAFAQEIELSIQTKLQSNSPVLQLIPYTKTHPTKKSALAEVDLVSHKLTKMGFLNNQHVLIDNDTLINCSFTLNNKISILRIHYSNKQVDTLYFKKNHLNFTKTYFEIPIEKTETTLNSIIHYFEEKGNSFTKASLDSISQNNTTLSANLNLTISKRRNINAIIIKGYDRFPKKYLKHYLGISPNSTFNADLLLKTERLINTIPFALQIKQPEVLFTKDSTALFLYLKKKTTSVFDGILGFSNNEKNNKIKFNGYLNLQLHNIFDKGESIGINWKNNISEDKILKLNFDSPYIFNSKLSFNGGFSIFKKDSTYTSSNLQLQIKYNLNNTNAINTILENENSNASSNILNNDIVNFEKKLIGLSYTYKSKNNKFRTELGYLIGTKLSRDIKSDERKIQFESEYNLFLNTKNSILIKNTSKILNSSFLAPNEYFRIGGINSMRGFDDFSISTPKYSVTNVEYHYNINRLSSLYSITDFTFFKSDTNTILFGIGVGYFFTSKSSIINLSYVIGKSDTTSFKFNNSRMHLKISYPF